MTLTVERLGLVIEVRDILCFETHPGPVRSSNKPRSVHRTNPGPVFEQTPVWSSNTPRSGLRTNPGPVFRDELDDGRAGEDRPGLDDLQQDVGVGRAEAARGARDAV